MELLGLFMLGNNHRIVTIDGSTTSSAQGVSFTDPGGLLALSSNMGRYTDDEFVVIPELGATFGYAICPESPPPGGILVPLLGERHATG